MNARGADHKHYLNWAIDALTKGCLHKQVVAGIMDVGYSQEYGIQVLNEALGGNPTYDLPLFPMPLKDPLFESNTNLVIDGHEMQIVMGVRGSPWITVVQNFLTKQECETLIEHAKEQLTESMVVRLGTGGSETSVSRSSEGTYFPFKSFKVLDKVEERISKFVNWPQDRMEELQILRYGVGGRYEAHWDYFDPNDRGSQVLCKSGGNRVGTMIMYLNTPTKGGATGFVDMGIEVAALQGNAVFFAYDCVPHSKSKHAGTPVLEGEKWIATKWIRDFSYSKIRTLNEGQPYELT